MQVPRQAPCFSIASIAYIEQVGWNRQADGNNGDSQRLYSFKRAIMMERTVVQDVGAVSQRAAQVPAKGRPIGPYGG